MHTFRNVLRAAALSCGIAVVTLAVAAGTGSSATLSSFAAMDADRDGRVSVVEHAQAAGKMFAAMDANKDGRVTPAEMTAAQQKVTGKKAARSDLSSADKIKVVDTDGDGVLAAAEHAAGSRAMFDRMDGDKDGTLTKAEFDAGHAAMLKK